MTQALLAGGVMGVLVCVCVCIRVCMHVCVRVCTCVLACAGQGRSVGGQTLFSAIVSFPVADGFRGGSRTPASRCSPGGCEPAALAGGTWGSLGLQQSPSTEGMARTHVGEEEDCSRPAQLLKMCQENEA